MVFENEIVSSLIIAIVQGLTEWLPVSSSGHLVLFEKILQYRGGLMFDVALHFGTLMAVFVYFGADIVDIIRELLMGKLESENGRLGLLIIVATIPAALVGFLLKNVFEQAFSSLAIVAVGFAITGVFLLIVSIGGKGTSPTRGHARNNWEDTRRATRSPTQKYHNNKSRSVLRGDGIIGKGKRFGYLGALLVGIAQIFSLFPGVSRSGATIGSGLLLGLNEKNAVKFSFLMSIPIIFGASILTIGNQTLPSNLIWATLVSFIVGLGTIHLLYGKMLAKRKNLKWFAVYALLLAVGIGVWMVVFRV
ncbi:MAG: undecaprenyl-diphosphate phosphatase [Nanoarchaeota archaeon]|nr:undecaprenyl-diphosphate phosphatase [Nanoarchaeota archaeon]MBU1051516.1 undecaprenyl-diphosphate phosphatase [Nanoarchaeota archaeon]MBU1988964.1 undecaprenyl-diphosphate phosphatase [Nanoarchaeota archaeon]